EILQGRLDAYNSQRRLFVSDLGLLYIRNILQGESAAATYALSVALARGRMAPRRLRSCWNGCWRTPSGVRRAIDRWSVCVTDVFREHKLSPALATLYSDFVNKTESFSSPSDLLRLLKPHPYAEMTLTDLISVPQPSRRIVDTRKLAPSTRMSPSGQPGSVAK
ncbi:MAG: hypothetical protein SGPRY_007619, partial [Prymnesium sp.]